MGVKSSSSFSDSRETAKAKSKVELDRAIGQTLNRNNISMEEAWIGIRR